MPQGSIKYILVIIAILTVAFLSQQSYSQEVIKNILSFIEKNAGAALMGNFKFNLGNTNSSSNTNNKDSTNNSLNTDSYNTKKVVPSQPIDIKTIPAVIGSYIDEGLGAVSEVPEKVGQSIKSGGESVINSINNTKEKISDTEKNISNYFSGITNSILSSPQNNNCPTN